MISRFCNAEFFCYSLGEVLISTCVGMIRNSPEMKISFSLLQYCSARINPLVKVRTSQEVGSEVRTISVPLIPTIKPSRSLNMSRLWSKNFSSAVTLVSCKTACLKYA